MTKTMNKIKYRGRETCTQISLVDNTGGIIESYSYVLFTLEKFQINMASFCYGFLK